jgi:hypothetical protein
MPDLITHSAFSWLLSRSPRFDRFRVIFYLGTVLPDIITRPIYILSPVLQPWTTAMHTPLFMTLFCFLAAEFFVGTMRKPVRLWLLGGVWLHFFLDLFQRHIETGYLWFFPFSWKSLEIGLFWPETPLLMTPLWLAVVAVVEGMRYTRHKKHVGGS